jgi:hypothetical protein
LQVGKVWLAPAQEALDSMLSPNDS